LKTGNSGGGQQRKGVPNGWTIYAKPFGAKVQPEVHRYPPSSWIWSRHSGESGFINNSKKEPLPIRTAKIHAAMWETDPIYIVDHSQIVGSKTPTPSTEGWDGGGGMANAAVYNYPEILPEPLAESLQKVHEVGQFWDEEGDAMDKLISMADPEDIAKFQSGAIAWGSLIGGYSGKKLRVFHERRKGL